jgi:hypothetical protein
LIRIYGSSDDLIEIESSNQAEFRSEEFPYSDPGHGNGASFLATSDGTLLAIDRDRFGTWRFIPLNKGKYFDSIFQADEDDPSDVVFMHDYPKWIVMANDVVKADGR